MSRSPTYERQWFEEVARAAQRWGIGPERFFDHVRERLEKGGREYGENSWTEKEVGQLVREAVEEAADIPAWLVLAAQTLNRQLGDEALDPDGALAVQAELVAAAACGLHANEHLRRAMKHYREALSLANWKSGH